MWGGREVWCVGPALEGGRCVGREGGVVCGTSTRGRKVWCMGPALEGGRCV